jgi:metal-responsive CopG/Arc/MetJ family transcriptional regulator
MQKIGADIKTMYPHGGNKMKITWAKQTKDCTTIICKRVFNNVENALAFIGREEAYSTDSNVFVSKNKHFILTGQKTYIDVFVVDGDMKDIIQLNKLLDGTRRYNCHYN